LQARATDVIALSTPVVAEIESVLRRPKFARVVSDDDVREILALLVEAAIWVAPAERVTDCRDRKDNMYLELAAASQAEIIVSSDSDLLTLDPWRGIRILRAADYISRS